jgi:DNA (cytosine-5)-methyltransferase 1
VAIRERRVRHAEPFALDCHKDGTTYEAVFGRMWWDKPAPTLTPWRGRFIHPKRPRTLTQREAARVQGFPDWFDFFHWGQHCYLAPRSDELDSNALPPILGYAAGFSALAPLVVATKKEAAA